MQDDITRRLPGIPSRPPAPSRAELFAGDRPAQAGEQEFIGCFVLASREVQSELGAIAFGRGVVGDRPIRRAGARIDGTEGLARPVRARHAP